MSVPVYPGAEQILAERNRILSEYDRARAQSKSHEVETYHGNVGEAMIRDWLARFLPARYGVTPGFVVSQSPVTCKLPHFDVIIYDRLESPVIWIEDNPDRSPAGHSRAIPVEYVLGVVEVKSALKPATARAAVEHLNDLAPFLNGFDPPSQPFKKFLPERFFSFALFMELREGDAGSRSSLNELLSGIAIRGYRGAMVLRSQADARQRTGRFDISVANRNDAAAFRDHGASLSNACSFSDPCDAPDLTNIPQSYLGMLIWHQIAFSQFAFDIVALLNGTYQLGRISSFYGFNSPDHLIKYEE